MIYLLFSSLVFCGLHYGDALAGKGSHQMRKRSMLEEDPCLDAQQVDNLESVELLPRYAHLKRPWLRTDITPKVFTSSGLRYQWMWAKSLAVRGLKNGITIDDLLRFLDGQNCSFLAIGDAVWQTVQRGRPVKIEGEISCSMKELYTICLAKYGGAACSLFPSDSEGPSLYRMEIGDARANRSLDELKAEPLMLYEWGSTLGLPAPRWAYTVTTMAIHDNNAGQVYLVDLTGRGYMDTCGKSLSAAVDDSQWKEWADEDISKAYRFYHLRTQGFGLANHELQNYVNKIIESRNSKKAAQTFYCESILGGVVSWAGEDLTTACHLVFPDHFDRKRISRAREILQSEMSSHWNTFMAPAIDEMEAVYLTERQFVNVRNRLKGRISGDLVLDATVPSVIRPGEPMVNDISDVHRRPIMSKGDLVADEQPKEKIEDVLEPEINEELEPQAPIGAGFNDPVSSTEETHIPKRDIGKAENFEPEKDLTTSSSFEPQPSVSSINHKEKDSNLEKERESEANTHTAPQQSFSLNQFTLNSCVVILLPIMFIIHLDQLLWIY